MHFALQHCMECFRQWINYDTQWYWCMQCCIVLNCNITHNVAQNNSKSRNMMQFSSCEQYCLQCCTKCLSHFSIFLKIRTIVGNDGHSTIWDIKVQVYLFFLTGTFLELIINSWEQSIVYVGWHWHAILRSRKATRVTTFSNGILEIHSKYRIIIKRTILTVHKIFYNNPCSEFFGHFSFKFFLNCSYFYT